MSRHCQTSQYNSIKSCSWWKKLRYRVKNKKIFPMFSRFPMGEILTRWASMCSEDDENDAPVFNRFEMLANNPFMEARDGISDNRVYTLLC